MNLGLAFDKSQTPHPGWTALANGDPIPAQFRSKLADTTHKSKVGIGIVWLICEILCGRVKLEGDFKGHIKATFDEGKHILYRTETNQGSIWAGATDTMPAPYLMTLVHALYEPEYEELRTHWQALVNLLRNRNQGALPFEGAEFLNTHSSHWSCQNLILPLIDSWYYSAKILIEKVSVSDEPPFVGMMKDITSVLLGETPTITTASPKTSSPLSRIIARGGTALLTGPTGTFKTESAKRAAIESQSRLVVVKGMPGLEDRDLLGAVVPTVNGPQWVDGPLTKAFRHAQNEKTVLIVDELSRFEGHYQAVFIVALDELSPDEVVAMGMTPILDERHRLLTLTNGEQIIAPRSRLSIIATTNLGDDYIQASNQLDAALLGRFNLVIDYPYPDPTISLKLYSDVSNPTVAKVVHALELFTRTNTVHNQGLLQREANPRVIKSLLEEYSALLEQGDSKDSALLEAAKQTLIPFCVQRNSNGALEESGTNILIKEITKLSKQL
jgi:MoxR-like ATPase